MSNIKLKTGSEGPRHDPYGYTEITVDRQDGRVVTLHSGLAYWCKVYLNGKLVLTFDNEQTIEKMFTRFAGISSHKAEEIYYARRTICDKCGCNDCHTVNGYPGETLYICNNCDEIVTCDFN